MAKNKNKNAANAATLAEKKADKKNEIKNETVESQVAAKTVTAKTEEKPAKEPAKEPEKVESKKEEPKKEEQKPATQKEQKKKAKAAIPTIIPEPVDETTEIERAKKKVTGIPDSIPVGSASSSLDGKAMLSYVMMKRYGENKELQERYPEVYQDAVRSIDVVTVLALADLRKEILQRNAEGELQLTVDVDQVLPLQGIASMLGITLAPAKALPGTDGKQLTIDFKEAKVPETLTTAPKVETAELDPTKITNEEDLKNTLNFLITGGETKDRNVATNIVNTVEWYRKYCIEKEQNADAKLALDDKTVDEWITEIFGKIKPTGVMTGLGSALYTYTSQTGNPVKAHCLLHKHVSKTGWSEEQIASMLKCLINFKFNLEKKEGKFSKPEECKALVAIISDLGNPFINKVFTDINETPTEENKESIDAAKAIVGLIRTNYFDKEAKPTVGELRMKLGQIINLYRNPMDRMSEYMQSESVSPMLEDEFPKEEEPAKEEPAKDEKKN